MKRRTDDRAGRYTDPRWCAISFLLPGLISGSEIEIIPYFLTDSRKKSTRGFNSKNFQGYILDASGEKMGLEPLSLRHLLLSTLLCEHARSAFFTAL